MYLQSASVHCANNSLITLLILQFKFIQSLEALQDGEHEQQRRHFIYFLLHQVTVSRNFSSLMRKKACQVLNSFSILLKDSHKEKSI